MVPSSETMSLPGKCVNKANLRFRELVITIREVGLTRTNQVNPLMTSKVVEEYIISFSNFMLSM